MGLLQTVASDTVNCTMRPYLDRKDFVPMTTGNSTFYVELNNLTYGDLRFRSFGMKIGSFEQSLQMLYSFNNAKTFLITDKCSQPPWNATTVKYQTGSSTYVLKNSEEQNQQIQIVKQLPGPSADFATYSFNGTIGFDGICIPSVG